MAFGLDLSTLGNLGRAASRGIAQNTAFNEKQRLLSEQQRLLGGQEADRAASKLLLKAAVDPTPENIQAATDAMGNASGEFTQRATPLLAKLSQLPAQAAQEDTRRHMLADRAQVNLQQKALEDVDPETGLTNVNIGLDTVLQPRREAFAGLDPVTPDVSVPETSEDFTLGVNQIRFGPEGQEIARGVVGGSGGRFLPVGNRVFDTTTRQFVGAGGGLDITPDTRAFEFANQIVQQTGKPLATTVITKLSEYDIGIDDLERLAPRIMSGEGSFGPIEGNLQGLNPLATETQVMKSEITKVMQVVAKGMEGGVLRAEDMPKYRAILPAIGDTRDVALKKLVQLTDSLKRARAIYLANLAAGLTGEQARVAFEDVVQDTGVAQQGKARAILEARKKKGQ
jgi:hypothetical protein